SVALRPQRGAPLLVLAARSFFRRAVETDAALFQGLAFAQMEQLQRGQEEGFRSLHGALAEQGERLERVLGEVYAAVVVTRDAVLDIQGEQRRQGEQHRQLYQAVIDMQQK